MMRLFRSSLPPVAILDAILLVVILLALNFVVAPKDPGWLGLNPSPYLVLPILIGGRFGFLAGVMAGGMAAVAVVLMQGHANLVLVPLVPFLVEHAFLLTALVITGGLCGEIQHFFYQKLSQLSAMEDSYKNRIKRLDNELFFLRETKSELDAIIATSDSDLCTLDTEIRELYLCETDQLYEKILALLNRKAEVTDAALYQITAGAKLNRVALLGNETNLPLTILAQQVEMVELALERKTVVTIPEFWKQGQAQHRNYLLTLPLLDYEDRPIAFLIVTGMPFFALNHKNAHLISVICKWASRVIQVKKNAAGRFHLVDGIEQYKIFRPEVLRRNLDLSFYSFQLHRLPSVVVLFALPGASETAQPALERVAASLVRPGDCPATLDLACPHLAVLLPLTGERKARHFADEVLQAFQKGYPAAGRPDARLFSFEESETVDRLWQDLNTHVEGMVGASP